jgi:hypothetical protein
MKTRLMKTINGSLHFTWVLIGLVAITVAFSTSAIAQTESPRQSWGTCGPETLNGSYVFNAHGFNIIAGVAQPKAIVEGIDFNGDGTLVSPFATVSLNGVIIRTTGSTGTYTVNADCTGTVSFTAGPSFDIFVGRKARQVYMIQTGPEAVPAVFEGTATKVSQ